MARVQQREARKRYVCGRVNCGRFIEVGETYYVAKPYRAPKIIRCINHPPRASETTSSEKLSAVYAVQEELDDLEISKYDDQQALADDVGGIAERAHEAAQMFEESADNIEDGFGHSTMQSDELRDQGSEVDSWADEIDQIVDGIKEINNSEEEADWRDVAADLITDASSAMPL